MSTGDEITPDTIDPEMPPCVCCDTTDSSTLISILCGNPFANGGDVPSLSTNPEVQPYFLALPALAVVSGIYLYVNDWTTNSWYSVITSDLVGSAGLAALYFKIKDCTWFEALGGVSLLQAGLWMYASNDDAVSNTFATYFDLAVHIAGIGASAFGMLTNKNKTVDQPMEPPTDPMPPSDTTEPIPDPTTESVL